jgi:parvulin-like peptidyl-prolyl isomerase
MACRSTAAWVAIVLGVVGCQAEVSVLVAQVPAQPIPVDSSPSPRLQKADTPGIRQTVFDAVRDPFPGINDGRVSVKIRAHVNGIPILDDEVREACYPYLMATLNLPEPERSAKQAEIFQTELQQIIDREVLLQDAFARLAKNGSQYLEKLDAAASKEFDKMVRSMKSRAGVKTDEELKEFLRAQGQSLDGIRRQVKRNFMAREYMRSRIFPAVERIGHEAILDYYQTHTAEFQVADSVKWQDVFIDASRFASREEARRFAEGLAARARAGQDFAKLLPYDNGDSSYRNGEGYGQRPGEIKPPEAEPLLFRMRDGEVGPVIEMPTGFHIIRLVKRQRAGLLTLDEKVQAEIRKKLQGIVAEREAKKLVTEMREKATIEIAGSEP